MLKDVINKIINKTFYPLQINMELTLSQKFKLSITLWAIILFVVMFISLAVNNQPKETIKENPMDDEVLCPVELYEQYWWGCVNHINDRYPWKLTASWDSQEIPELIEKTSHDRFKELAYKYWLDPSEIWEVENKYWIREWLILAILIAETSGWKNWAYVSEWCYNLWNVGNNDRWDRRCYTSKKESIEAIGRALSNQYLWTTQTLGCLSKAWSCTRWEDKWHVYASSGWNWERTITNVLNAIYQEELWEIDPERFNVRRIFTTYQ